jgi:hypothetical protein
MIIANLLPGLVRLLLGANCVGSLCVAGFLNQMRIAERFIIHYRPIAIKRGQTNESCRNFSICHAQFIFATV